jgi:ABC-type branched-subunit amino acid transport system substrate-binding protein
MVWALLTTNSSRINKIFTIIMRIFNYCDTGFTFFFSYISTSLSLKGLIVRAIMLWGATGMLMFSFVPVSLADSGTLIVIGHYYSSISLEGGKIYKEYGIPAVTASATAPEVTEGNDWYFRVVPDTNLQGKFSALYIKNILEQEAVYIVFEQDAYGTTLQRSFERASRDSGLHIKNIRSVDSEIDDVDRIFDAITHELRLDPNSGALFVALQDYEAAKLVRSIRDAGIDLAIMGGDAKGGV